MTSDGDALFRAICENPRDETVRLIYADWLDEQSDQFSRIRAEFIRLQCESFPMLLHATLAARRTRASALLKAHGDRWYNELPVVSGLAWGDLFVGGFIDSARTLLMTDVRATLEAAFAGAPLQFLTVTQLRRGQLAKLLACPLLARLRKLNLPGTTGDVEDRELIAARTRFPDMVIV